MTLWIKYLLIIFTGAVFCAFPFISRGQNLYDSVHTRQYAEFLYSTRQYAKAAEEYKRLLVLTRPDDSVVNKLLDSWKKSGMNDSGISFIYSHYPYLNHRPQWLSSCLEKLLVLSGRYKEAGQVYDSVPALPVDFRFYIYALQGEWKMIPETSMVKLQYTSPNRKKWEALIERQNQLKYKSPGVALALSTVVPGAGKIYSGDWKDGLVSMLLIGSMAYESYTGFHTRGSTSVLGWVFGGLAVGYYGGNIYGSWHSAKRYNARLDNEIHEEAYTLTVSDF